MKSARKNPTEQEQKILDEISLVLLEEKHERKELQAFLKEHHYLGELQASGEQLHYFIVDGQGEKIGGFIFSEACKRLKWRDNFIGWTDEQRRRRLGMVVNNSRFVLKLDKSVPNLGSRALKLVLQRLSDDWQKKYKHPVLLVETFVDPHFFNGACYRANLAGAPRGGKDLAAFAKRLSITQR